MESLSSFLNHHTSHLVGGSFFLAFLAPRREAPRSPEGERRDSAYKRLGKPQATAPHESRDRVYR